MFNLIENLDISLILKINNLINCSFLDPIMIFITKLGDKGIIWILISLILILNKKTRKSGYMTIATLILVTIMGEGIIKHIVKRLRPYDVIPNVRLIVKKYNSYSFTSGHSASSFAAASMISKYNPKLKLPVWILAILIVISRVYLYLHFPTDVIAGAILGLISTYIVNWFDKRMTYNK